MGTTEESAVDPLTEVLDIREKFSKQVSVETLRMWSVSSSENRFQLV